MVEMDVECPIYAYSLTRSIGWKNLEFECLSYSINYTPAERYNYNDDRDGERESEKRLFLGLFFFLAFVSFTKQS